MLQPLRLAVVGVGRMGVLHALHVHELAEESGRCTLAALVDLDIERAQRCAADLGSNAATFSSIAEMLESGVADATVLVTPTDQHRANAAELIAAGHRVLMEKPLTGALDADREFAATLERDHPDALMLAFQRRFDEPLQFAKELVDAEAIGRVFKIYSALEDSRPAPDGYRSGGILADMAIHNVDEVLWFLGEMPDRVTMAGSRLYSHRLTTCQEDFDDALLLMWFPTGQTAQVQVSRNHVSGYRVETILYGERGRIHVGHFDQRAQEVTVEAYGRRGTAEPLARRTFPMRDYGRPLPEFADRFGPAYKAEVEMFVECCLRDLAFPTTHTDALQAQEVIAAATPEGGSRISLTDSQQ